jgi:hypothetical protein
MFQDGCNALPRKGCKKSWSGGNWLHVLISLRMALILVRPMTTYFLKIEFNLGNSMVLKPLIVGNPPFPTTDSNSLEEKVPRP